MNIRKSLRDRFELVKLNKDRQAQRERDNLP